MRKSRIAAMPVMGAIVLTALMAGLLPASAQTGATASKVTVGSPPNLTPRNHQNEPAVAIDAHNPNVLVAGVNDFIDNQPCPHDLAVNTGSCLPAVRPNVGVSGVYFSFDRGHSWTQPTYTGWTARDCSPADGACPGHFGPIGTRPWYYENGLVSFGHGTGNAFDEAAWLVTWAIGQPLDALETRGQRDVTSGDISRDGKFVYTANG